MQRIIHRVGQLVGAGLFLLALTPLVNAQYGPSLPYHTAVLGSGPSPTPGYGAPPPYVNSAPTAIGGSNVPAYASCAPYTSAPSAAQSYYPAYGYPIYQGPTGSTLQGLASLTQATGGYWKDIQSARITREQSRQAALDTQRKQIEFEMWYEKNKPTALTQAAAEKSSELKWARDFAQRTQIWGGRPLNVLLQSIFMSPQPGRGPYISLDQDTVRGLNLTEKTTRANLALAKDDGAIGWTEALQAESFDAVRDRFSMNFTKAIKDANTGTPPPISTVRNLRNDLKALSDQLDDQVQTLAPSRYIEARRLLNQLKSTIEGLSNPRLVKAADTSWKRNIATVADLVMYCQKNGLEFGPAVSPSDYASYTSFYYSIRNYERGIWQAPPQ